MSTTPVTPDSKPPVDKPEANTMPKEVMDVLLQNLVVNNFTRDPLKIRERLLKKE